eukprot:EG_transcript_11778
MAESVSETNGAEFDTMVQQCLHDTLTAPTQSPGAYCQLFPDLQLNPTTIRAQFGDQQPQMLLHSAPELPRAPGTSPKAPTREPYPPHIEAILARKKYEMPSCDEIESEELVEADDVDFTLPPARPPAAGLKVDSFLDESPSYVPSGFTPKSSSSTPRNRTPLLPPATAPAEPVAKPLFPPDDPEPLRSPTDAAGDGGEDFDSGDETTLQLPDGAEEEAPSGVRFAPAALAMQEIQKTVVEAEESQSKNVGSRGRSSSKDSGLDLSAPFRPLAGPPDTAPEGLPLQLELPNLVTAEEGAEDAADPALGEEERELLNALRHRPRNSRQIEDFQLPPMLKERLSQEGPVSAGAASEDAPTAECSDEVQPFTLEEGFDYDNVKLTPKAYDRFVHPF